MRSPANKVLDRLIYNGTITRVKNSWKEKKYKW